MAMGIQESGTITKLLQRADQGDLVARDAVFERAYPEMRRLAKVAVRRWNGLLPETATDVVNQVCERLIRAKTLPVTDRVHFYRLFGRIMHAMLIDEFRASKAIKRGGKMRRQELNHEEGTSASMTPNLIDLREALQQLSGEDPDAADAVNLKFFCGQSLEQAADKMGASLAVYRRHLEYGIAWLRTKLGQDQQ